MQIILEEYGEAIIEGMGAMAIIIILLLLIAPTGILSQWMMQLAQSAC